MCENAPVAGRQARRTGNMFEKQRMTDVFRVPFVVPAPKARGASARAMGFR